MANWLQNRLRAAEDLLEAVDRTAKTVAVPRWDQQDAPNPVAGRRLPEQVLDHTTHYNVLRAAKILPSAARTTF